jgi:hypothetical protein
MDRMGHSTTRAAMVYLHGSDQRQQVIADALGKRAAKDLERPHIGREKQHAFCPVYSGFSVTFSP